MRIAKLQEFMRVKRQRTCLLFRLIYDLDGYSVCDKCLDNYRNEVACCVYDNMRSKVR